ncbi:MAG TPA: ABC transporter permease, partial [Pseudomonas sp.]|uniref:ABC transporter permease n=1 Tax=Pseudomonas sp. TaxID=306 RepID=UPI002BC5A8B9|nr:ABC transporter permease [Pseudomonas sp.]
MAKYDAEHVGAAPWLLCGPALLVFMALLLAPLLLTAVLSVNLYSDSEGVIPVYSLGNYLEVFKDDYFHEIFLRTGWMALAVTLLCVLIGVPETIIIARMAPRWRSLFLVVVLGPLLISVVVRTLGWALLLGNNGLINDAL